MEATLKSLKDTQKLAKDIVLKISETTGPAVIALYGELGSGKTTFTQFLAKELGIKEKVLSPTFVIMKTFALPKPIGRFKYLTHADTYRLKSAKDLIDLGLKDIIKDKENILIIEWPEKIEKYLPKNTLKIYFKLKNAQERIVVIKK